MYIYYVYWPAVEHTTVDSVALCVLAIVCCILVKRCVSIDYVYNYASKECKGIIHLCISAYSRDNFKIIIILVLSYIWDLVLDVTYARMNPWLLSGLCKKTNIIMSTIIILHSLYPPTAENKPPLSRVNVSDPVPA